jgi:glycine hydroxymethyltransferase
VDLTPKGLTGKAAELALDHAGITVNKNSIPFDQLSPNVTSGIRIGTPAISTRGMTPDHMDTVANFIHRALQAVGNETILSAMQAEVAEFCSQFRLHQPVLEQP